MVWGRPHNEYHAAYLAEAMEWGYDQVQALGFHFGEQDDIYPLSVYIMEPPRGHKAEHAFGKHGKGAFAFHPMLFDDNVELGQAAIHEVFHHGQQFYDSRPSEEWESPPGGGRTWLDEATARVTQLTVT